MSRVQAGFTLVELIIVMVVTGIIAGMLTMFFVPSVQNYVATGRRATLSDQADTAMRRMIREMRTSVPNSVRVRNFGLDNEIEFVPTSGGGRYRNAPDVAWDIAHGAANQSLALDTNQPSLGFDVLTPLAPWPAVGDLIVIGNQSPTEIYNATNVATISQVAAPPAAIQPVNPVRTLGTVRIQFANPAQFPQGYDGGRFFVVPAAQQAVTFFCQNPGLNGNSGRGRILRASNYGLLPSQGITAPGVPAAVLNNAAVLATNVEACTFNYLPGTTQESGYVEITLTLTDGGESITMSYGAHVVNVP
jgi:MSHA biogenesis protein MshO